MLEIIKLYPEISATLIATMSLTIGYLYRARKDKRTNLKSALYTLLEIWHRLSVFYPKNFEPVFDLYIERVSKVLGQPCPEEVKQEMIEQIIPIIDKVTQDNAFKDLEQFSELYNDAVKKIASNDPIFAYQISSFSSIREFLEVIDNYLDTALSSEMLSDDDATPEFVASLKGSLNEHTEQDALKDLENAICSLALKTNVLDYFRIRSIIKARKNRLKQLEEGEIEGLVDKVLLPAILDHIAKQKAA